MKIFAFDIETIPNQLIPASCVPVFDPSEIKYGNTKDPSKKALKEEEERKKFDDGLSKKMSLDPAYCQLVTFVGIQYDTDKDEILSETIVQITDDDEDKIGDWSAIHEGWSAIHSSYNERVPIITFNGLSFDLPVLFMRAILQDAHVSKIMYDRLTGRYSNAHHFDLMQILANFDRQRWHSLDFYFRLFGIGDKSDFDGSMVYDAYKAKEFDKIKTYCRNEVLLLCKLFQEVEPWIKISTEGGEV